MSFYGQVIQEFTKLFDRLKINATNDNETPMDPADKDNYTYQASTMWETITMSPANRWIRFGGEDNNANKTVTIGHGTPGAAVATNTAQSVTVIEELPEDIDECPVIKNGDYLDIITTKYDAAGHLATPETGKTNPSHSYYRMPTTTINIAENVDIVPSITDDKLYFKGDDQWINLNIEDDGSLKFSHDTKTKAELTPEEGSELEPGYNTFNTFTYIDSTKTGKTGATLKAEIKAAVDEGRTNPYPESVYKFVQEEGAKDIVIYPLQGGELVKCNVVDKDLNGHIIDTNEVYLQMPMSAGDLDWKSHGEQIDSLKHRLNGETEKKGGTEITYEKTLNSYEENVKILDTHEEFLTTNLTDKPSAIWKPETLYSLTGSVAEMYTEKKTVTDPTTSQKYDELINKNKNLASTIGKMDGADSVRSAMRKLLKRPEDQYTDEYFTISDAIRYLTENHLSNADTINTELSTIKLALDGLAAQIKSLKGE